MDLSRVGRGSCRAWAHADLRHVRGSAGASPYPWLLNGVSRKRSWHEGLLFRPDDDRLPIKNLYTLYDFRAPGHGIETLLRSPQDHLIQAQHRIITMREYIDTQAKLEHLLCILILVSRLGDIGSTYLVTPKLKLEANPFVRKLGWLFAVASLLLGFVPYYSTAIGIVVLVPSLMVSASNTSKIWFARAYGEGEYLELLQRMASKSKLSHALAGSIVSAAFIAIIGFLLLFLSPDPSKDWGYWFAIGFLVYGFAIAFHHSSFYVRLFRKARQLDHPKDPPV